MRVVTYRIPVEPDECALALGDVDEKTSDFLRILHQQAGFLAAQWGLDSEPGTMVVVTFWNSREAFEAAGFVLKYLQQRVPWPQVQVAQEIAFELS